METEPTPQDQDLKAGSPAKGSGAGLDLSKILLPKKNTLSTDSAQRVDASVLMAQENNATLVKPAQDLTTPLSQGEAGSASAPATTALPQTPPNEVPPSQENYDELNPLQTFQGDIASAVQGQHMSAVTMAAAEATRRENSPIQDSVPAPEKESHFLRTAIFFFLGIFLFASSVGLVWFALLQNYASAPVAVASPFIATDAIELVDITPNDNAASVLQKLKAATDAVSLSLGLVAELRVQYPATTPNTQPAFVDARTLLNILAPSLPDTFIRAVQPTYLLGVHVIGVNQPFLLLQVDSYEQAYAGMLAWERSMRSDLSPVFVYTPAPKTPQIPSVQQTPAATSTATSTATSAQESAVASFVATDFTDKIVKNRDARVLQTADGSVYFLWTFLDRSTILITTDPETLQEITLRLKQAPLLAAPPGQQ